MAASGKKLYEKPEVETERIFETLGAGCTFISASDDHGCDPEYGGLELSGDYWPSWRSRPS